MKGKKLPLKPKSDDEMDEEDDDDTKPRTGKDGKDKKKEERSEHGVWVGNIPFTITPKDLQAWIVNNSGGSITEESITRLKLPMTEKLDRDNKKQMVNKGFAFVDFDDIGPKTAAIALSETDLQGRKLLIKDAKSYEGRPQKTEADRKQPETQVSRSSHKIFIGNLGYDVSEEELRSHFEKCGEIQTVKVAQFQDSGKCKGFAWVTFKEPESADWAVKGYAKIKVERETEKDFAEPAEDEGSEADDEDDDANKKEKKFYLRKWWVNRLKGRQLKIELAEDDQFRYKKRFGKNAAGREESKRSQRPTNTEASSEGAAREFSKKPASTEHTFNDEATRARLMGTAVKATGKKVTFD